MVGMIILRTERGKKLAAFQLDRGKTNLSSSMPDHLPLMV